jgi:RNA polymerase sigma-70 factor (ECF subfamily)
MVDAEQAEMIERLKARDEAAFNRFVREYQQRVFRLCLRMLGERAEAEDVAQEVFVSIFKAIGNFRGDSQLSTWVYRVTTNHCRNRLKYNARRHRQATQQFVEEPAGSEQPGTRVPHGQVPLDAPDRIYEGRETQRLLQEGLMRLDEEQRELLVLREVEHLSYDEIIAVTGLPGGTVKSRLHRARASLREFIDKHERGRPR